MSKVEKALQEARAWRKKHTAETIDFAKLDGALAGWELKVKQVEEAKEAVKRSKAAVATARKAVSAALKEAKASRKSPA